MNGMRARVRILAACLCLLGLVACGNSDSNDDSGSTTPDPAEGETFTDPQGSYVLTVAEDWRSVTARDPETEGWAVAPKRNGFTPNVSVIAISDPEATTVDGLMDLSLEGLKAIQGFELLERSVVVGAKGQELGVLSYSASPGAAPIFFLSYTVLRSDKVVIATLTATATTFEKLRQQVEPYLLTLEAT